MYFDLIKCNQGVNKHWWSWSSSNKWSIDGKLPKYGNILDPTEPIKFETIQPITEKNITVKDEQLNKIRWCEANRTSIGEIPNSNSKHLITYHDAVGSQLKNKSPLLTCIKPRIIIYNPIILKEQETKLIVFDYPPFDRYGEITVNPQKCGKCEFSYNTSRRNDASVIVYYASGMKERKPLAPRSFPEQLYVWLNLESPASTYKRNLGYIKYYDKDFNMTMTYRRHSDAYFPYFTPEEVVEKIRKYPHLDDIETLITRKKKLIAWVAGNCGYTKATSNVMYSPLIGGEYRVRMMVQFLHLGLPVEIFGACTGHLLPGHWWSLTDHMTQFKFYFAMENSYHCRDYITEKVWWNALRAGVVPVIWGPLRQDVEAVLPAGSFIFMEDYDSAATLVKHLQYLDIHTKEYLKYFEWRDKPLQKIKNRKGNGPSWLTNDVTGYCQLCHMIHDDDVVKRTTGHRPNRIVNSLHDWWYMEDTKTCLTPKSFTEYISSYWWSRLLWYEYHFRILKYYRGLSVIFFLLIVVLGYRRFQIFRNTRYNQSNGFHFFK
uniref:Fucosyltransferase n=1 Tax=Ciona savignyi TaxID=51511 RepID=Q6A1E4_CIOSA|nr:alpha3-fucosyltransferase [Ciona savignyi]